MAWLAFGIVYQDPLMGGLVVSTFLTSVLLPTTDCEVADEAIQKNTIASPVIGKLKLR